MGDPLDLLEAKAALQRAISEAEAALAEVASLSAQGPAAPADTSGIRRPTP